MPHTRAGGRRDRRRAPGARGRRAASAGHDAAHRGRVRDLHRRRVGRGGVRAADRGQRPPLAPACRQPVQRRRGEPPQRVRDAARQPAHRVPPRPVQLARRGRGGVRRDGPRRRRHRRRRARGVRLPAPVVRSREPRPQSRPRCGSSSSARPTSPRSPTRSPSALARRDPSLGPRVAVVADLEGAAPAEAGSVSSAASRCPPSSDEATGILRALGARGMKVAAIDRRRAFEDVRRVRVDAGEVLVEAGTSPAFVYLAVEPGLRSRAARRLRARSTCRAWLPIGVTGVVRRAERNSTVVAVAPRRGADDSRRALRPRVVPSVRGAELANVLAEIAEVDRT